MEKAKKIVKASLSRKIARLKLSSSEKSFLEKLLVEPIAYIPNENFRRPKVMKAVMERKVEVLPGSPLSTDEEQALFLQLNFIRYKMCQIRRKLLGQMNRFRTIVRELLQWYNNQLEARSKIVTANMGLVLAMAKRAEFPGVEFTDLVSEGSMALLPATDKFDCSRGFKFSTYACRAIFKGFSRTAKQSYRYRNRFPTQWDAAFEKDDHTDQLREERHNDGIDEVRMIMSHNFADLSSIEQSVVEMRFSLRRKQPQPLTLKQVGDKLGLTKERIRQIQNKALAKLRVAAQERIGSY